MLIYDVLHKEKVYRSVANNLRSLGVKHRLKKNGIKNADNNNDNNFNNNRRNNKTEINSRKVFKVSLSYQRLDVVNLSSGGIVHVPLFICQARAYLEKFLHQEGLFRKAGSQARQKELIARIDNGASLGDKNHAIDVASCLKTFFRNLPEPLIPYVYHDLFVRCLVLPQPSQRVEALMLACILLPPHHLNTLAFFMDFLKKVSLYESLNKMSIDNLSTVIAPNIMPLQETTTMSAVQTRLEAHLVIVKILIENAKDIGVLPEHISEEIAAEAVGSLETEFNNTDSMSRTRNKKKKKHRSGSLTRMLNGLKKMVGKSGGSPGQVGQTPPDFIAVDMQSMKHGKKRKVVEPVAPIAVKKKRDVSDAMPSERTNQHSRDLLATSVVSSHPNPVRDTSPSHKSKVRKCTTHKVDNPVRVIDKVEKGKKLRMSLDRFVSRSKQKVIDMETENGGGCNECYSPCIERRWSSASSSSVTRKDRENCATVMAKTLTSPIMRKATTLVNVRDDYDRIFMEADVNLSDDAAATAAAAAVAAAAAGAGDEINNHRQDETINTNMRLMTMKNHPGNNRRESSDACPISSAMTTSDDDDDENKPPPRSSSRRQVIPNNDEYLPKRKIYLNKGNFLVGEKKSDFEEYVRIPKSEYEEIKNRVSAIESQISKELRTSIIGNETDVVTRRNSVSKVQSEYEKTLGAASIESTINAHYLAKRLSKELKIRRSSEHKIIRSPSARKIGILRRRSQEKVPPRRVVGPAPTSNWQQSQNSEKIASINRGAGMNQNKNNNILQSPKRSREENDKYSDANNVESTIDSLCSNETNARLNYLQEQLHTLITHTAEHTRGTFTDDDDDDDDDDNDGEGIFTTPNKLVRRASSFHGNEFIDNSRYFNNRVKELKKTNSQQNIGIKCCDERKTRGQVLNDDSSRRKTICWKDAAGYFNSELRSNSALTPFRQTGRASIAKLRTQNAGMVLAKAKLFDDNETRKNPNDSSIEEKKKKKKMLMNEEKNETMRGMGKVPRLRKCSNNLDNELSLPRKSSPIGRRKQCKSPKNNNIDKFGLSSLPNYSPLIKMDLTILQSQENSRQTRTDIIKRATANGRGSKNFEQDNRDEMEKIFKSPSHGQTLKPIETTYFHESNINIYNPDVNRASCKTPHIKRSLAIKTPKSARSLGRRTPTAVDTRRTPLKAVPTITTPKRQSPRNFLKSHQLSKPVN